MKFTRCLAARSFVFFAVLFAVLFTACTPLGTSKSASKKVIFIAGRISHGAGEHEHRAGCLLLQKCLAGVPGLVTEVYTNGWPADERVLDSADAIVIYSDGGGGHPALQAQRLQTLDRLMKKGVGLGCIHYAVEPTKDKGQREFLEWIGGCFEIHYSVNPHWTAEFKSLPKHPVTQGVQPFQTQDEWYFNMRFREGMKNVQGILTAIPPQTTMNRPDGPHSGNPFVRATVSRREPVHVMWAAERNGGGRGFGFTGGHFHRGWGKDDQRKTVLNAILWIAKLKVPRQGVHSVVTPEDLQANLDPKPPRR
ncbi:MAG: hypothetical protein FJ404_04070 [Verrucomicrobia bacterium]|nr:hypothetical protein [Verrucomicrobiota bacterium]